MAESLSFSPSLLQLFNREVVPSYIVILASSVWFGFRFGRGGTIPIPKYLKISLHRQLYGIIIRILINGMKKRFVFLFTRNF